MDPQATSPDRSVQTRGGRPPRVTVIVVSYNTREITLECLRSLRDETQSLDHEVIVVDNASHDGSAEAIARDFPEYDLIASTANLGFGAANNLAAERARGERLLLLNPDTVVLDHAVDRVVQFADRVPSAGIWGGRTLFADRSLNRSSCWGAPTLWSTFCIATGLTSVFRHTRLFDPESLGPWPRDTEREVDIVVGCFLLIDRELWNRLEGFDPLYFMYGEDADLCIRARELGARPRISPEATIVHLAGASEPVRAGKMIRLITAKAQMYTRLWSPWKARLGVVLLDLWALSRRGAHGLLGALGRTSSKKASQNWKDVWDGREGWRSAARALRRTGPRRAAGTTEDPA